MTILTAQRWLTNAHLIEDVAQLGYLDGRVLDCTYGLGNFWTQYRPEQLISCDLDTSDAQVRADFTSLPFATEAFDAVMMDPPYKLNGTPDPAVDRRYGVHEPTRWQDRMTLIARGIPECARALKPKGFFSLKCMDQVVSGRKIFQTDIFCEVAAWEGLTKVDRFDMLVTPRPQPKGRRQVHTQQNYSTLLVFQKEKA